MPNTAQHITNLHAIVGEAYVLTNESDSQKYTHDRTGKFKGKALAVVRPGNTAEVSAVMLYAQQEKIPVVPQSGNTGLAAGAYPGQDQQQILLSLERMNAIRDIKPEARTAIVEAGVVLETLQQALLEHDLQFPLSFGAKGSCMLGGNLSTNAGGSNVLRYGNTRDLCLGLEVVMADGRIVNLMSELHKDNTGYDLKDLFIGAEGTLGIITAAVLKLSPKPQAYATAMISVAGVTQALQLLNHIQTETGGLVEAFELMPKSYLQQVAQYFPELTQALDEPAECNILLELGASASHAAKVQDDGSIPLVTQLETLLGEQLETEAVLDAAIAYNEQQRKAMWLVREQALETFLARGAFINCDIALPLGNIQAFLDTMADRLKAVAPNSAYNLIAHLGDGNLHYAIWPDNDKHKAWDEALADTINSELEATIKQFNGTFSAEHGIGLTKVANMQRMKDPNALAVMWMIKKALDPYNLMNPGKVLPVASVS